MDDEPLSELAASAITLHETFIALVAAGFETKDALYFLACVLEDKGGNT